MKRQEARFHGILCLDKPEGFTSFDAVAKLRGMTRQRRIGHGGTLDPFATGVLPVFFGRATRLCDMAPVQEKRYTVALRLGVETDTQDLTGTLVNRCDAPVSRAALEQLLPRFTGDLLQLPPMYSAVQVGGRRLYDLARQGLEVERQPRPIRVEELNLLDYDPQARRAVLDVRCSKGTYVRTLCHDIGAALGVGGAAEALRRTEALGFALADCRSFDDVAAALQAGDEGFSSLLLPIGTMFRNCPTLNLTEPQERMFCSGVKLDLARVDGLPEGDSGLLRVLGAQGGFLGVARADRDAGELVVVRNFCGS